MPNAGAIFSVEEGPVIEVPAELFRQVTELAALRLIDRLPLRRTPSNGERYEQRQELEAARARVAPQRRSGHFRRSTAA